MSTGENKPPPKKYDYDEIIITLENSILPPEKVDETPAMKDGLDRDTESELRMFGCEMIQIAGLLLKLPQVAMATGQVILQRFFYSKSLVKFDIEVSAMAAIYLAAKIEEAPRRIRDVINVCNHIRQKKLQKVLLNLMVKVNYLMKLDDTLKKLHSQFFYHQILLRVRAYDRPAVPMDFLSNQYFTLKNAVIKTERRILIELGFCVHVKHPHKIIITYLQILEAEKNVGLARKAWNYMNDSLRTDVFVRYVPEKIACACIFLAARVEKAILPSRPPWWRLFGADYEEIEDIATCILRLYSVPRRRLATLQSIVGKLKKVLQEKKATQSNTPTSTNGSFTPSHAPTYSSGTTNTTTTAVTMATNNNNHKPSSKNNSPEKDKKLTSVVVQKSDRDRDSSNTRRRNYDRRRDNDRDRRRRRSDSSSESESDSGAELPSHKYARQKKQYERKQRSASPPSPGSDSGGVRRRSPKREKYKERNGHREEHREKRKRSRSPVKRERPRDRRR